MNPAQQQGLQRGGRHRSVQAGIRRAIESGQRSPAFWLNRKNIPDALADLTVFDFVQYVPGVDEMAARRYGRAIGANRETTVGSLGLHRRRALVNALERAPAIGSLRLEDRAGRVVRPRDHLPLSTAA